MSTLPRPIPSGDNTFFEATIVWEEENTEINHHHYLFCALNSEDELTPQQSYEDNDIFHYGITYEQAKALVGKQCSETGEDFMIVEVH